MRILGVGAVVAVALVTAGAVLAGNPTKEKIARTAAGNAQAKAEVVRRADLGSGWKGGFKKPDLSSSMPCTSYRPKQSDLVLIGVAETTFSKLPFAVDSEAQVLRTASMVQRDWQRTILDSRVIPCLRQALVNLLENAVKYSPDGGRVALELEARGGRLRFLVHDEGIGIPAADQRRIFDRFVRLDPQLTGGISGTGLGLPITRDFVARMGGSLTVSSLPGRGSTFTVELPAAAA